MTFHPVHGANVVLGDGLTRADRRCSFFDGVVFSGQPLVPAKFYTLILGYSDDIWEDGLRIGVTTRDPQDLLNNVPKFTCPSLLNRSGFWAVQLADVFLARNRRIVVCIGDAEMRLVVDRNREESILYDLPVAEELWLMLDLYGRTTWAKFVQEGEPLPLEVYIRGPEAVNQHLSQIERNGSFPLIRTRILLVGADAMGKQLLNRALSGRKLNESDERKEDFCVDAGGWHLLSGDCDKPEVQELPQAPEVNTVTAILCGEDHWSETLAANVVTELMIARKRQRRDERRGTAGDLSGSRRRPNTRNGSSRIPVQAARNKRLKNGAQNKDDSRTRLGGNDSKLMYLLDSIPDRVLILVENLMRETETKQKMDVEDSEKLEADIEFSKTNVVPDYIFSVWELEDHTRLHPTLHSLLMTPRAIYILVFDLNCNLDELVPHGDSLGCIGRADRHFTHLDYLLYWMHTIYCYATPSVVPLSESRITTLSPPILIVGCSKSKMDVEICDKMIEESFSKIRASISGKVYERHVVTPFVALHFDDEESQYSDTIFRLLIRLREIISLQNYFGEIIPQSWFKVENEIGRLVNDGINFVSLEQVLEVARSCDVHMEDGQRALLHFLHDAGVVFHFGGAIGARDETLSSVVILNPTWIIQIFNSILNIDEENIENEMKEGVCRLKTSGILDSDLLEVILRGFQFHKELLLELMEKLDLLSNIIDEGEKSNNEVAFIPCMATNDLPLQQTCGETCTFFFGFLGQIPGGLFHQLTTRAISWSLDRKEACKEMVQLFRFAAVLPIDEKHNFILHLDQSSLLLKVTIVQSVSVDELPANSRRACAEVRELLESTLADLRELWVKRLAYVTTVRCPCGKVCSEHQRASCLEDGCVHFLSLDECLSRNAVYCEHRKVKTDFVRQFFPRPSLQKCEPILRDSAVTRTTDKETVILDYGGSENDLDVAWKLRGIAKLLSDRQDWMGLAKSLGYRQAKIADLEDDLNPSLALVADWLTNSGNGAVAVDMLAACMRQNGLLQAAELVDELKDGSDEAAVFISYQWDVQDDILAIRAKLEEFGLTCWMDVGQMGGGDHLYNCIYQGISRAKVIIACVTPKYTVSHNCTREASLADLLGKPIIPVMVRKTPWPPPGPLALLFSQLIYVDMCDGGGHGGRGRHGDWEDRVEEIILQISHHVAPTYHRTSPQRTIVANFTDATEPVANVLEELTEEDRSESWSMSDDAVPFEDVGPLPGMLPSPDDDSVRDIEEENDSVQGENEATPPRVQPSVTRCSICVIL